MIAQLCDSCGAKAVTSHEFPPLSQQRERIRYVTDICDRCGKEADVTDYVNNQPPRHPALVGFA